MTTVYTFKCAYTKLGIATNPSVAPLCTVVDTANNVLANAQATTALANLTGVYLYSYSGADDLDLIGKFSTTDISVDMQDLFSYTPNQIVNKLDARVSSRSTYAGGDTSGVTMMLADYARRTGDYSTLTAAQVWAHAVRTITGGSFSPIPATVTVVQPVAMGGNISIVHGDDYKYADNRALEWSSAVWPNLTGATVTFEVIGFTPIAMTTPVTGAAVSQTVRLELTKTQSVYSESFIFRVVARLVTSADVVTLVISTGQCFNS
jgi:hypothetical protein